MSGLEVVAAVSAVISAFHGGSELVKHIKRKNRRKKKEEQVYKEKALQESLESGEVQVHQRYQSDCRQIGPRFRTGDPIARDRLLHIAVIMQAEIIRSLQIAVQYENAVLDLTLLHENAVMNRRDTISALDELKQRILLTLPLEQSLKPPSDYHEERRPSMESVRTFMTAHTVASDFMPPAVILPEPEDEHHGGLGRFLSRRGPSSKKQAQTNTSRLSLLPNFDWLSPAISTGDSPTSDLLSDLQAMRLNHSAPKHDSFFQRKDSSSTKSGYSDRSNRTSSVPSIPPHDFSSPRPDHQISSPVSPITPDGSFPGFHPGYERTNPAPRFNARNGSYSYPDANERSRRTDTIWMTGNTQAMHGRPCKDNNYWGFCRGAWNARESIDKGITLATQPSGMYSTIKVWQCRSCNFEGKAFNEPGKSKKIIIDPNIHNSGCGIRYRWVFLAKSHVKKKGHAENQNDYNFGCIFCSMANRGTSIFGNAETLMNHIYLEHSASMTKDMQDHTRCVFGRLAENNEDFDINIPFQLEEKEGA